jgi:hypothetical protein
VTIEYISPRVAEEMIILNRQIDAGPFAENFSGLDATMQWACS